MHVYVTARPTQGLLVQGLCVCACVHAYIQINDPRNKSLILLLLMSYVAAFDEMGLGR